jgi:hypothetical protein
MFTRADTRSEGFPGDLELKSVWEKACGRQDPEFRIKRREGSSVLISLPDGSDPKVRALFGEGVRNLIERGVPLV